MTACGVLKAGVPCGATLSRSQIIARSGRCDGCQLDAIHAATARAVANRTARLRELSAARGGMPTYRDRHGVVVNIPAREVGPAACCGRLHRRYGPMGRPWCYGCHPDGHTSPEAALAAAR